MTINNEYRNKVREALAAVRPNFDGSDNQFAKSWGMQGAILSRIQKGQVEGVLADANWIRIGRELGVGTHDKKLNNAQTDVFIVIERDVKFCKENAKAKIFVDACGIGKTHTAKYLAKTLRNCFYIDASQAKTKQLFIRRIAKALGVDQIGSYNNVKENAKYYLRLIEKPIIIIDEAGDLDYGAFLELKEFWNATEGYCGWYMMGADGLKHKIEQGIANQKVGYREIFSRFSSRYTSIVPTDRNDKVAFYKKLFGDVLSVNVDDKSSINQIINRCITKDGNGNIDGLRRVESILILNSQSTQN